MVSEAAVLLATRRDELPRLPRLNGGTGGVVTPAFAFGNLLRDELHAKGVTFREHALGEFARVAEEGGPTGKAIEGLRTLEE